MFAGQSWWMTALFWPGIQQQRNRHAYVKLKKVVLTFFDINEIRTAIENNCSGQWLFFFFSRERRTDIKWKRTIKLTENGYLKQKLKNFENESICTFLFFNRFFYYFSRKRKDLWPEVTDYLPICHCHPFTTFSIFSKPECFETASKNGSNALKKKKI